MERRGILTKDQREAVKSGYRNLTYHPGKMKSDIETQIESLEEDLRILKQHDEEFYQKILKAVENADSEESE